jgi:hypothetical protein
MRSIPTVLGAAALAGLLLFAPGQARSQTKEPLTLRKAQDDFARLQEELARVNAEIAELKRADRSVRGDYRLRDRMADAEALAQKLGRSEARLRSVQQPTALQPRELPLWPPPQESPQDGRVELEAKADLFADQAGKLEKQADVFAHAADQLRARRALLRRAGAWDRDPFAGLESSRRNLAAASKAPTSPLPQPTTTPTLAPSGTTGGTGTTHGTGETAGAPPNIPTGVSGAAPSTDSASKSSSAAGASESPASKSSPLAPGFAADRQLEQRLYLDPTTAAELRQIWGSGRASSDPDALDRAAAALRARARDLGQRAALLRRKSQAP